MRAVQSPNDIADRLGDWSISEVGERDSEGYPLKAFIQWMQLILSVESSK